MGKSRGGNGSYTPSSSPRQKKRAPTLKPVPRSAPTSRAQSQVNLSSPRPRPKSARQVPAPRPVRPPRPNYARRRLLVLCAVLLVLAALTFGVIKAALWVRQTIRGQDAAEAAQASVTVYPTPVACTPQQLRASVQAPQTSSVGTAVNVTVTATNTGQDACLLNVGGDDLGLVVTSGGATVLTSAACPGSPEQHLLLVDANDSATVILRWDTSLATSQCLSAAATNVQTSADADAKADASASATNPTVPADGSATAASAASAQTDSSAAASPAATAATSAAGAAGTVAASAASTQIISGGGDYAGAGTYQLFVQLDGQNLGSAQTLMLQ